ncbi:MAG: ferrous iron transporter B [Clostridia bacterium]|nr:ferrous iron transporter B [Clostridia bacterium]
MGLTSSSSGRGALREKIAADNKDGLPVVALAGNPNVGKSTVFNALTGLKQHTGNWSGKTVSLASGRGKKRDLVFVDLPGCRSLSPASLEESIARDALIRGEYSAVIAVVNASGLEASLALALQVLALTSRAVICLNLIDEAEKHGTRIDVRLLSKRLGVPVIPCTARSGRGLGALEKAVREVIARPESGGNAAYRAFLPPVDGGEAAERAAIACLEECSRVLDGAIKTENVEKRSLTERLDRAAVGKYTAFPVMFLLLMLVFYITLIGANYPSELLYSLFSRLETLVFRALCAVNAAPWLRDALVFGMLRTVFRVVSVMLPPMAIFFPLFTLAEDLGYLPRAAFCLDRCFRACGSCGKQALTVSMGFGCNAAGVVGCRIIENRSERISAMLTNSLVPCNGRFPLLITLVSVFLFKSALGASPLVSAAALAGLICFAVAVTLGTTKILSKTLFRGESSPFLMELPPYRPPKLVPLIIRSVLDRTLRLLVRAVAVAAPAGLVIYAAANIPAGGGTLLSSFCALLDAPARFFGLDGTILAAFILALPANEIVLPVILMAYTGGGALGEAMGGAELLSLLQSNGWTLKTACSVMIFTLFHWPCSTTLLTVKKEAGGVKWMLLAFLVPTVVGLVLIAVMNGIWSFFAPGMY